MAKSLTQAIQPTTVPIVVGHRITDQAVASDVNLYIAQLGKVSQAVAAYEKEPENHELGVATLGVIAAASASKLGKSATNLGNSVLHPGSGNPEAHNQGKNPDHTTDSHKTTVKITSHCSTKKTSSHSRTTKISSHTSATETSSHSSSTKTSTHSSKTSSSSASPSASAVLNRYFVIPNSKRVSSKDKDKIEKMLNQNNKFTIYPDRDGRAIYWLANSNRTQIDKLKSNSLIKTIEPDQIVHFKDPIERKKTGGHFKLKWASQHLSKRLPIVDLLAPRELQLISQDPSAPGSISPLGSFHYDDSAGEGITIYFVDTGAHPSQTNEFIYGDPPIDQKKANEGWTWNLHQPGDYDGHGTSVLSKGIDRDLGVAIRARAISAVIPKSWPPGTQLPAAGDMDVSGIISTWNRVLSHIELNGLQFWAVINFSVGSNLVAGTGYYYMYDIVLDRCKLLGVVVVVSSGNDRVGGVEDITYSPAIMEKSYANLIVVGSIDIDGECSYFSQGIPGPNSLLTVSAMGNEVLAQTQDINNPHLGLSPGHEIGTSFAASQVAGLAAYFMSIRVGNNQLTDVPLHEQIKSDIIAFAWLRDKRRELPAIYNAYWANFCTPYTIFRQDLKGAHACPKKSKASGKHSTKSATTKSTKSTSSKHRKPTSTTTSKPTLKTTKEHSHISSKHTPKTTITPSHTSIKPKPTSKSSETENHKSISITKTTVHTQPPKNAGTTNPDPVRAPMDVGPANPPPSKSNELNFKCSLTLFFGFQSINVKWAPIKAAASLHNSNETWFCDNPKRNIEYARGAQAISRYSCQAVVEEDKIVATVIRLYGSTISVSDGIKDTFPGRPNVNVSVIKSVIGSTEMAPV
ncbi:peptidase S8/S53 domain-containing protein [Trichophaea hybrida]|nr:peptidase S8/S53 domain-containing protein [Trichophaea hybrida]